MSSSTIAGKPCCMHVPMKVHIDGWRSWERMRASCTKERSASLDMQGSTLRIFTATDEPCHAPFHTLEPPPSPSRECSTSEAN